MALGEKVELTLATIETTALTDDGRPAEATFRFHVPLDDPSLRWLQLSEGRCSAFVPPAIGETIEVPSPF
jgi:hypothetical protein